jgi:hypothetical protein
MQYWQRKLQRSVTDTRRIADAATVPVEKRIHRHDPSVSCRAMLPAHPARRAAR